MSRDRKATIMGFVERASSALEDVTYYQLLGVAPEATAEEVRTAYYRYAASLHPDVHGLSIDSEYRRKLTTVFSRVVEAYQVLSDAGMRARYDRDLAKGKKRLEMGADVEPKGPTFADSGAKKFYDLGKAALGDGDFKSAVMNLRFA